ncbi:hypothetical protein AMECASPLE_015632 [Ameca splendens]|uniref:Uncharacterized protein n=1 Tax=Ameca splendens TaxID=208324 RepID=A0ABV0YNY0_9TELE
MATCQVGQDNTVGTRDVGLFSTIELEPKSLEQLLAHYSEEKACGSRSSGITQQCQIRGSCSLIRNARWLKSLMESEIEKFNLHLKKRAEIKLREIVLIYRCTLKNTVSSKVNLFFQ